MAETTSEASESEQRAAAYRFGILARTPTSLKEHVALLVVRGVELGLVTFHAEAGLAVANTKLAMPPRSESVDEVSRVRALGPFLEEYRAVEDIRFALKLGYAQWVALTALGVPLPHVGSQNTLIALELSGSLALVSEGVAPSKVLGHVRATLENRHAELTGLTTEPWLTALETIFETGLHLHDYPESTRAEWVLSVLPHMVADVPPAFANPKREQIKKADTVLDSLRISSLKPDAQPKQRRKGPADSPWGAAIKFAECFGRAAPKNKRDAKKGRGKK